MTVPRLLDANALIALTVADHEHHQRASRWAAGVGRLALCPVVEGALVRFLIRLGQSPATVTALLDALHQASRYDFWPDALSYREIPLAHVTGHRQVTDAYLAGLAAHHGGLLATFDQALARTGAPHVELIP